MNGFSTWLICFGLAIGLLVAPGTAAACDGDTNDDGSVDVVDLLVLLGAWGSCGDTCGPADLNGDGSVDVVDLLTILGAWGECPAPECPAGIPEYYEQFGDEISTTAGGTCVEYEGVDGPPACPQEEHAVFVDEINYMLGNYPFTGAVFDASTGGGQAYGTDPFLLICSGFDSDPQNEFMFDDLNECYHGSTRCLFDCGILFAEFDWAVNVWQLLAEYNNIAAQHGGICELNGITGGSPQGFHAAQTAEGWRAWNVTATDQCDYDGCRCSASLTLLTNPDVPGQYVEMELTNNSGCINDTCCEDPRFAF